MKKLITSLAITTALLAGLSYSPKSHAGIIVGGGGTALTIASRGYIASLTVPLIVIGGVTAVVATASLTAGVLPGLIVLLVLEEDGALPQDQLESVLSERYHFINDREVISMLALEIKSKADEMDLDQEGKKVVTLDSSEVRPILIATELSEEEIQLVVEDLK